MSDLPFRASRLTIKILKTKIVFVRRANDPGGSVCRVLAGHPTHQLVPGPDSRRANSRCNPAVREMVAAAMQTSDLLSIPAPRLTRAREQRQHFMGIALCDNRGESLGRVGSVPDCAQIEFAAAETRYWTVATLDGRRPSTSHRSTPSKEHALSISQRGPRTALHHRWTHEPSQSPLLSRSAHS